MRLSKASLLTIKSCAKVIEYAKAMSENTLLDILLCLVEPGSVSDVDVTALESCSKDSPLIKLLINNVDLGDRWSEPFVTLVLDIGTDERLS